MNQQLQNTLNLAWQIGDWQMLASTDLSELKNLPGAHEYALKIAVAHFQLSDSSKAQKYIRLAQELGGDKATLLKYLISSFYQTLAQAQLILNSTNKAVEKLNKAVQMEHGEETIIPEWLMRARIEFRENSLNAHQNVVMTAKTLHTIDLGQAWAGNSINTVIFRHHAVFTHEGKQYTAFYVDASTLRLIKRDLETNAIEHYDLLGEYNLKDAHNCISLGMDRNGHLHISYDHHSNRLNYRCSLQPYDISEWSDLLDMTGGNEERVTYPAFILPTQHQPLLILYRDGHWKQGTAYLKYYDETLAQWFDFPSPILSGAEQRPWTSNAYWNHPSMDINGVLHLSYTWRTDYFSAEQLVSNINVDYAKSYDGGLSWFTSKDQPYKLPITQTNSETVWPISPGSNHINQTSMALDSKGQPHIVFYANDPNGIPQYQHVWFDGRQWLHSYITQRDTSFILDGGGTLEIPISRPEIVIDSNDTVYVIYRAEETDHKLVASYQTAPHYACLTENTIILWNEDVGHAEPIIDRIRWQQENILTILVQHNQQPNGDLKHVNIKQPIQLIDIQFQKIQNLQLGMTSEQIKAR